MFKSAVCSTILCTAAATAFGGTPAINGTLDLDAGYTALSVAAPGDKVGSFGSTYDASGIYYTHDATNVYFFVQGKRPSGTLPGILLLINTSSQSGAPAGTALGNVPQGDHIFSTFGSIPEWKMDFEVDQAFVLWNTATVHTAQYVGTPAARFIGTADSSTHAPAGDTFVQFAVNYSGISTGLGSSTGWELAIKRSSLGNPTSSDTVQAFAVVVDNGGSFSLDSVPANLSADPGTGADFTQIAGNQFTSPAPLPVTISAISIE